MLLTLFLGLLACSGERHNRSVYVLVDFTDISETQQQELKQVMLFLLAKLQPGESLALARIDSRHTDEKDVLARMTFDQRPSIANSQKRAFIRLMDNLDGRADSEKVDITGSILRALEYLNGTPAGQRYILLFSDLNEEQKNGRTKDFPISFNNARVVTVHAIDESMSETEQFNKRLEYWRARVEQGGGTLKHIEQPGQIEAVLDPVAM